MPKINKIKVKKFYSEKNIVAGYDDRRFSGLGGVYINNQERLPVLSLLKKSFVGQKSKVLDLGAGRGRLSVFLMDRGYNVWCLDASSEMKSVLNKFVSPSKIIFQSAFDSINYKKYPKFDALVSLRFFEHFSMNDQRKILTKQIKGLKNGGLIVFTTVNKNSLEYVVSSFFKYGNYNYFYTRTDYLDLFKSLGLDIVGYDSRFFMPRGLFIHLNKIGWLLKTLIYFDRLVSGVTKFFNSHVVYSVTYNPHAR